MKKPLRARQYQYIIAFYGLTTAAHALATGSLPVWYNSLFFVAAGIGFLQITVQLPSGAIYTPSLPLVMAALLIHGLPLAILIVVPGSMLARYRAGKDLSTVLYTGGLVATSAQLTRIIYTMTGTLPWLPLHDALSIIVATLAFDLINVALSVGEAALIRGVSAWQLYTRCLFRDRSVLVIPYHLLTLLTCLLYLDRGLLGLITGLLCVLALKLLLTFQQDLAITERQARSDHLSGAFNHRFLSEWFETTAPLLKAQRRRCTVFFIDMDELKEINDKYGHAAGDRAIRHMSELLRASIRTTDILCRYGGDEFVVVCPDLDASMAQEVADRILSTAEHSPLQFEKHSIRLSFSLGTASFPDDHPDLHLELVKRADAAMYRAKNDRGVKASRRALDN